jgi:trehalose/maltose transport system permease protein
VVGKILFWLLVIAILLYTVFPFYWALVGAIKPGAAIGQFPPSYWPDQIDWGNLRYVFEAQNGGFLLALRNSLLVSVTTVRYRWSSGRSRPMHWVGCSSAARTSRST